MVAQLTLNPNQYNSQVTGFSCLPGTVDISSQLLTHRALVTTFEIGPIVILSLQTGKLRLDSLLKAMSWKLDPGGLMLQSMLFVLEIVTGTY